MNDKPDHDLKTGEVLPPQNALEAFDDPTLAVNLEQVDIDQLVVTAHKYPRSIESALKKISTLACYNAEAAENCIYSLPRGGKPIIGPSIGFANIVASCWGNCRDKDRLVAINKKEKIVITEGLFWDLESNRQLVISAKRRIVDSKGRLYSDDMIIVTAQAAGSIARRNAILNGVPRAMWHPIFMDALNIVRGDVQTFAETKGKALTAMTQFGVKPEQIYMVLGLKGEADLTFEHIPLIRGMYQALRDQSVTVEEMFDPRRQTGGAFDKVENPLASQGELHDGDDSGEIQSTSTPVQQASGQAAQATQATPASGGGSGPGAQTGTAGAAVAKDEASKIKGKPGRKSNAEKAAAAAAAQNTAGESTPAATGIGGNQSGPSDNAVTAGHPASSAAAVGADSPATSKPAEPVKLRTPEEYEAHANAWIDAATSVSAMKEQWGAERSMRTECRVVEDVFERVRKRFDAKAASLQ